MITVIGCTRAVMGMCGVPTPLPSIHTPIGRRIAMDIGVGYRLTDGFGSMMSRGDGRRITMAAGYLTMATGFGHPTVITGTREVGGSRHWSLSTSLTTISAGTRLATTITTTILMLIFISITFLRSGQVG